MPASDPYERLWAFLPPYQREGGAAFDVHHFVRHVLGYAFVSGSTSDGATVLFSGTADPEEVDVLRRHLAAHFPEIQARFQFRPRPLLHYQVQPGDTWPSMAEKFYGTDAFFVELFNANWILYVGYDRVPKITEPPPENEFVYVPKLA